VGCVSLAISLVVGLLIAPPVDAQTAVKRAQIGTLGSTPMPPALYETLKQSLAQLGYTEGQQIAIVQQHADGDPARLQAAATDLARNRPDVIFARGSGAVAAAARATTAIPIVAIDQESDPLALGYAKTLAQPGGNITGVFLDLPELSGKQLQIFREIVPRLARVALVGDQIGNAAQFQATERAAEALGVQVQNYKGRSTAELDAALDAARRGGAGAVLVFSSPIVFYNGPRIAAAAREMRLPTLGPFVEFAEAGGLLAYGPSLRESYRRCAVYVAKILNGAKAADLPIERPEKFQLVINMKTAKALGLTIPHSLQLRADQLIQ
jgi:putative ABC transport system substrate-binding protein